MLRLLDGAPGEIIGFLPVSSFNHPAGRPIITFSFKVLHRPVESALGTSICMEHDFHCAGLTQRMSHPQRPLHQVRLWWASIAQPSTRREHASLTTHKYSHPSPVLR